MTLHSIGARLTLWYASLFAVGLAALGVAMWLALRGSLYHAVDEGLRDRVVGIARFIEDHESRLDLDEVKEEFRAHGELFQVVDERGEWVHRGADLSGIGAPSSIDVASVGTLQTASLLGRPLHSTSSISHVVRPPGLVLASRTCAYAAGLYAPFCVVGGSTWRSAPAWNIPNWSKRSWCEPSGVKTPA